MFNQILILSFIYSTFLLKNCYASYGSPLAQSMATQELVLQGQMAFGKYCIGCHGIKGDGNGPAAPFLNPKPRNFTTGIFKFRSSPLGALPSDEDLMDTLRQGVAGTSMPSYLFVPERERFAMIEYIKTFSDKWKDPTQFGVKVSFEPLNPGDFTDNKIFIERAKKGQLIYKEACMTCHGVRGEGNGPGAVDLKNDWDEKIAPANLRLLTIKRGKSVNKIYEAILLGVNGTPMPAFKDAYTDQQLQDLTAYILYFRGDEAGLYPSHPIENLKQEEN